MQVPYLHNVHVKRVHVLRGTRWGDGGEQPIKTKLCLSQSHCSYSSCLVERFMIG